MEHKGTVTLETDRLILRRFRADDLEQIYHNCWKHHDVWKWTNYKPMNCLADVMENANMFTPNWLSYERKDRYSWAITLKDSGEVIGRMFGMHPNDHQVELAYELGPAYWNRGLMTEVARAAIDYFLQEVGLKRVYAYHADQNPASGRVMQKCGMILDSIEPLGCRCNNGIFDKVNYFAYPKE